MYKYKIITKIINKKLPPYNNDLILFKNKKVHFNDNVICYEYKYTKILKLSYFFKK